MENKTQNRIVGGAIVGTLATILGLIGSARIAGCERQQEQYNQTLREALTVADTDRDGIVEKNEFEAMYKFLGKDYTGESAGRDLSKADLEHFRDFYPIELKYKNSPRPSETEDPGDY